MKKLHKHVQMWYGNHDSFKPFDLRILGMIEFKFKHLKEL